MKKPNALGSALRNSGASVAGEATPEPSSPPMTPTPHPQAATAIRRGTKAITVHFPENVRRQLKSLAAEEGRSMEDMVGEALNLLFARHRKPELAPRKSNN
jgi:hypothetical protein